MSIEKGILIIPNRNSVLHLAKTVAPTANDTGYPIATIWEDTTNLKLHILVKIVAGVATWEEVGLVSPLTYKGAIAVNTDFPLVADVEIGWLYRITANVTDNAGVTYTNTGDSFLAGDEICWNGTDFDNLGPTAIWVDDGTTIEPSTSTRSLQAKPPLDFNSADTTITLTTDDLNRVLVISNGSAVQVNLPSVGSSEVSSWIEIHKTGAGNLTIVGADSDTIIDSGAGGSIANTTASQTYAYICLRLITSTRWNAYSMLGSWTTT